MSFTGKRQREEWAAVVDAVSATSYSARGDEPHDDSDFCALRYLQRCGIQFSDTLREELRETCRLNLHGSIDGSIAVKQISDVEKMQTVVAPANVFDHLRDDTVANINSETDNDHAKKGTVEQLIWQATQRLKTDQALSQKSQEPSKPETTTAKFLHDMPQHALVANFMPIILVPFSLTSPLQMVNIKEFLEQGHLRDPAAMYVTGNGGISHMDRESCVVVEYKSFLSFRRGVAHAEFGGTAQRALGGSGVSFFRFRVYDDPSQIKGPEWYQVCACITTGKQWEFTEWFPMMPSLREPKRLFTFIQGFITYFVDELLPPQLSTWNVRAVPLTRREINAANNIAAAGELWKCIFEFLDSCKRFRRYTLPP